MPGFTPRLVAMTAPVQLAPANHTKSAPSTWAAAARRVLVRKAIFNCILTSL